MIPLETGPIKNSSVSTFSEICKNHNHLRSRSWCGSARICLVSYAFVRTMRFTTFGVVSLAAVAVFCSRHRNRWNIEVRSLESKLLNQEKKKNDDRKGLQSWDDLAYAVQRYLHRVLLPQQSSLPSAPFQSKMIHTVQFRQTGLYQMNRK